MPFTAETCKSGDGRIFLGGSCDPTTWRKDIVIPALEAAGIGYFNPQISNWSAEWAKRVEDPTKRSSGTFLFVIDGQTRAIASMLEAVGYMARGRELYLVVQDMPDGTNIRGQVVTGSELGDLNRAREYVRLMANEFGYQTYESAEAATAAIVKKYGNK